MNVRKRLENFFSKKDSSLKIFYGDVKPSFHNPAEIFSRKGRKTFAQNAKE